MRFSLVYKKNNKYKELYSIMKNNIEEALKSFNSNLPKDNKDYYIRVIRPKAEYYDLSGKPINMDNQKLFVYRKPNAMVDHEYTDDVAITYASSRAQAYMKIKHYYDCDITDIEEVYFNDGGIAILTDY